MNPLASFLRLDSHQALALATEHSSNEPVILYKHSLTCDLCWWAQDQLKEFSQRHQTPIYQLVVQHDREISNEIAQRLGIRHESPQVIILHRGLPTYNASHRRITKEAVREALQNIMSP